MTVFALIPEPKPTWLDSSGDPLNGGKLFVYEAGSSTKATSYKDSDGSVQNANPIVLDSRGETPDGCYVATGSYKLVLAPSTDTDPPASAIWTRDNLNPVNDTAQTVTEWSTTGLTPTYVDADEFTLVGDQTTDHHVGRRIKATVTAGTVYGYISVSTWSDPNTDLTVVLDSGSLDSGLSVVDLGLMRSDGTGSIPQQNVTTTGTTFTGTVTAGSTLALNGITTRGDIPVTNAAGVLSQLALGTTGQLLTSNGTDPAWASAVTHSGWITMPSATDYEFTGIPSWATNIVVQCEDLSGDGTAYPLIQLVTAGGDIETGYLSRTNHEANSAVLTATNGYIMYSTVASTITKGVWHLTRADNSSDHDWFSWGFAQQSDQSNVAYLCYGNCGAGAAVDGINLTWTNGTDSFDGGKASLMYW